MSQDSTLHQIRKLRTRRPRPQNDVSIRKEKVAVSG